MDYLTTRPAGEPAAPAGPLQVRTPGAGAILRFAVPLMLGMMTTAINTVVDTLFIGRLGTAPLAAVPLAAAVYMIGWVMAVGLMRNAIAFFARAYGAGGREELGVILAHYHLLALAGLPLLLLYVQFWPVLSAVARLDPEVDALARTYLTIRVGDVVFSLLLALYSAFYQAIGNSRLPMLVAALTVSVNIVLDYGLIFGHWGLPALGVAGSALATVLAQACGAAVIIAVSYAGPQRRRFALRVTVPLRPRLMRSILRIGLASALGDCMEVSAWTGFILVVGRLGEVALAASNIGMQATHLLFLPGFAFGIAGASYIGRFLGAGRPDVARQTARRVLAMGVGYMAVLGLPLWFYGEGIAGLFSADPRVIDQAGRMFKVMAVYQASDGLGFITRTQLGGAGDTRVPMLVLGVCAGVVLFPGAWLLARLVSPPLVGAWLGAFAFTVVYAAAMQWRFRGSAWTRIRLAR